MMYACGEGWAAELYNKCHERHPSQSWTEDLSVVSLMQARPATLSGEPPLRSGERVRLESSQLVTVPRAIAQLRG